MNHPTILPVSSNDQKPYPIHCEQSSQIVQHARKHVLTMDESDGYSVAKHPVDQALRTVMAALEYALQANAWDGVGDALIMLQQIELETRLNAHQQQNTTSIIKGLVAQLPETDREILVNDLYFTYDRGDKEAER